MADQTRKIEDLSDEELSSMSDADLAALVAASSTEEPTNASAEKTQDELDAEEAQRQADEAAAAEAQAAQAAAEKKDDANEDATENQDGKANGAEADPSGAEAAGKGQEGEQKPTKPADNKGEVTNKADEPAAINYEAEYKKLLAPFKANGRDIQVDNVDQALTLMKQGANYNKKMEAMKPHLATIRTLENAGIKADDLSFLIDLHRRDPAAINKLVQDSKIDPMDLSAEKAAGYTPGNHRATDAEVELESVLTDLHGSAGFDRTLEIVTKQMDPASKQAVAANPHVLRVINGHIESGIYDLVVAEVDKRRMLGDLKGVPDLEAYRQVGDAMNASGKFAHILAGQPANGQQTPAAPVVTSANPKKADDSKRNEQKRGVAPAPGKASTGAKPKLDVNPLSMSDEDFLKHEGKF